MSVQGKENVFDTKESESASLRNRWPFYAAVALAALIFIGIFGVMEPILPHIVTGWLARENAQHHFHDVTFSALVWVVLIGLLIQVWNPRERLAALQQSILIVVLLNVVVLMTFKVFPPPLVMLLAVLLVSGLHPARNKLFRLDGFNGYLAVLVLLAAIPAIVLAINQIGLQLQGSAGDPHAEVGHSALMAVYGLSIPVTALLSSLRSSGWRFPAWSSGGLAILYGAAAIVMASLETSPGPLWGVLTVIWGVVFIITAEFTNKPKPIASNQ